MNENIQRLIAQVGTDSSGKWMGVDDVERFAELIVQECGRVLEDNELGGYRVDHVLREHFEDRE